MCVIIYVPKNNNITTEELKSAWRTNPDGAGFAVQRNGKVQMKRGFMDMDEYITEVQKYIGQYNIVLHFRISTSSKVNRVQTHPYVRNHVERLQDSTFDEVICMNGIVSCNYTDRQGYNDTMNYIVDHKEAFHKANQHIVDMIENITGSKWFIMRPHEIIASSKFTEHEGRLYSNTNHLYRSYSFYNDPYDYGDYDDYEWLMFGNKKKEKKEERYCCLDFDNPTDDMLKYEMELEDFFSETLLHELQKDKELFSSVKRYIKHDCNNASVNMCDYCEKCFAQTTTIKQIKDKILDEYGRIN